ncbi:MAG: hypothetical protein KJ044_07410, partial [Planctomycetes bacterium]|nr:hypothetical protein [Planctomycetota bacterium]
MRNIFFALLLVWGTAAWAQYANSPYTTGTGVGDYIASVSFGGMTNATGASASPYNTYYNMTGTVTRGVAFDFTLTPGPSYGQYWTVYVDLNSNNNFLDSGETLGHGYSAAGAAATISLTIPGSQAGGTYRLRVRCVYGTVGPHGVDTSYTYGEAEDYNILVQTGGGGSYTNSPYTSGTTAGDYITNVTFAGVNNTTGAAASPYNTYYNMTGTVIAGVAFNFSLTPGPSWGQYWTVYVDFNNNFSFGDSGETLGHSYSAAGTAATISLTVPGSTTPGTYRLRVRAVYGTVGPHGWNTSYTYGEAEDYNLQVNAPVPTLAASPTSLNLGSTNVGVPGTVVNYTLTASILTNDTLISAPAGVEFKRSTDATYVTTMTIPTTGSWSLTMNVRLIGTSVGSVSGNIVHTSTGANTLNVAVTGNVLGAPSLNANPTSLNLGNTPVGAPGTAVSYVLTGSNLVQGVTVTAPTGVNVSTNATSGFAQSITVTQTPTMNQTIWVRLTGASAGTVTGNVTNVHTTASVNVAVTGTVDPPSLNANPTSLNLGNTPVGTPGTAVSYTLTGSNLVQGVTVTAPTGVNVSTNATSGFAQSITVTQTPTMNQTIWVRLTGASAGTVTGNVTNVHTTASVNVAVTGTVDPPSLNANPTSLNLGNTPVGTPGTPQSYDLTGSNLSTTTTVTAPTGVEVSLTQSGGYAASVTINQTPTLAQQVWVRLAGTSAGTVTGNVTNVHTTASVNVAVTGTVDAPSLQVNPTSLTLPTTSVGTPGTPQSYDLTGAG